LECFNTKTLTTFACKPPALGENSKQLCERAVMLRLNMSLLVSVVGLAREETDWLRHSKHLRAAKTPSDTAISACEPEARTRWKKHMQAHTFWPGIEQGQYMVEVADPLG
jgi:hypothetical protein